MATKPRQSAATGNAAQVRQMADAVLANNTGATYKVLVAKYGDYATCKSIVRSLQKSFATIRCVEREKNGSTKYDNLACRIGDVEDKSGCFIRFEPVQNLLAGLEVETDSGQALAGFSPEEQLEALGKRYAVNGIGSLAPHEIALLRADGVAFPELGDTREVWEMVNGELVATPAKFSPYATVAEYQDAVAKAADEAASTSQGADYDSLPDF